MQRIRGKHTKPEQRLRKALWAAGIRGYRLHAKTPAGRPDLVFPGPKVAVFIDGCFWHGCPAHYVRPRSREAFWAAKLRENVERDRRQTLALEEAGWRVLRLWEHDVAGQLPSLVEAVGCVLEGAVDPADIPDWRVVQVDGVDDDSNVERRHLVLLRDAAVRDVIVGVRHTGKG